jgi:CubicO group peptidase (beta-lactamase class C family)
MKFLRFGLLVTVFFVSIRAQSMPRYQVFQVIETEAIRGMALWNVPGMSIAIICDDQIVYSKGFGSKLYGSRLPVTPDTVFQVGSVTKAFTVALIGQLVDEGKLDWDDHVVTHDSSFMMYDPWVTREFLIHDLFSQHSGMPSYVGDLQSFMGFDREHILHSLRYIQPEYSFRDKFSYVNNLFLEGAKLAELQTGKSWETLMQERILRPLGMYNSSVDCLSYETNGNSATMHLMIDGIPTPTYPGMPTFDWPYVYGPAGGLNTSANDLAKWLMVHMNDGGIQDGSIFSPETAEYMHSPVTPVNMGGMYGSYCQGWMRQSLEKTEIIWHNGNASGGKSFIGYSPKLNVGIVVITNLGGHSLPDALAYQFFDLVSGVKNPDWIRTFLPDDGDADTDIPEEPESIPSLSLSTYTGTYSNPVYGNITVSLVDKKLSFTLGAQQQFVLEATNKTAHTFQGNWVEVTPQDPSFLFVFDIDRWGNCVGVKMPDLEDGGLGYFERQ